MNKEQLSMPRCDIEQLKEDCRVLKEALTNHKEIRNGLYSDCDNLERENQQLKELLKECQQSFRGIRVQIEEFEYSMARKTAQIAIDEIDNAIGEKK